MEQSSAKKIKLNFIFGLLAQVITLALGIIIPRFFVLSFGSEVNGFIKGVDQIFVYVALLEAGVGSASLQALYKPCGAGDRDKMNGILSATNSFYKKTAYAYSAIILLLAFVYPLLVKSTLNYWLMVSIILLTGGSGVVAYFCHAKYKIFLSVDGRDYVSTIILTSSQILLSLGKVVFLLLGFNVIAVQSISVVLNIFQALIFAIYVKKKYGWLNLKVAPDKEAIKQKNSVLIHQIAGLVFNNTDVLVLTFSCGLNTASVYAVYKSLINMVSSLFSLLQNSVRFKLGQAFSDREKFLRLYDSYRFIHVTIVFSACSIALMFFNSFVTVYTDGMDINYVYKYLPLLFVSIDIMLYARVPDGDVIQIAGHFKQTRWRALAEAVINLTCSLIFVVFFDIYGVLMGTVVALLYRSNDTIIYSNRRILERSPWYSYKVILPNILFSVATVVIFRLLPLNLDNYFNIILCAVVTCAVVIPLQFVTVALFNREDAKRIIKFIKQKIKRKQKVKDAK